MSHKGNGMPPGVPGLWLWSTCEQEFLLCENPIASSKRWAIKKRGRRQASGYKSIFYHINIAVREDESECWLSTQAVVHIKVFF